MDTSDNYNVGLWTCFDDVRILTQSTFFGGCGQRQHDEQKAEDLHGDWLSAAQREKFAVCQSVCNRDGWML